MNGIRRSAPSAAAGRSDWDFRSLWLGESVSLIGDYVSAFVLPTVAVLMLHASSFQVGLLGATGTIAYPVMGLFVGVFLDRVRCRPSMLAADGVRLLAYGSLPVAAALGRLELGQLFVVALAAGTGTVVFDIAYQSYLPSLLATDKLAPANARLEMSSSVARFMGPSLGGGLLQAFGVIGALSANAASFLASLAGLALIRTPEPRPLSHGRRARIRTEIGEGAGFLWRHPLLRPLTISASLRNLGMNANRTVLILFMYRALHLSPGIAGLVFTIGAVAAILGALSCGRLVRRLGVGHTLLATAAEGFVWLLVPLTLIGWATPILMVLMFVSSLWLPIWNATVTTIRQAVTDRQRLSRVNATARTINLSTIPAGALAGGLLADLFSKIAPGSGLVIAVSVCSGVAALSLTQLAQRPIRQLARFPDPQTPRQDSLAQKL
jgi:MFS family permease